MSLDPFELAKQSLTQETSNFEENPLMDLSDVAELIDSGIDISTGPNKPQQEDESPPLFSKSVHFELVVPDWDLDKLSRSFFSAFKKIEDASHKADHWVEMTEKQLEKLIDSLPDTWPERDSHKITSKFLGSFFAVSQHHPISEYLDSFADIPSIPETFPASKEALIPQSLKEELKSSGWWARASKAAGGSETKKAVDNELSSAKIRLRSIGTHWLTYEHAKQLQGTTSEAGDFYFVFLKSVQRLFVLEAGDETCEIKKDLLNDVQQLAENLRSTHRSHLMYIYSGFTKEIWDAFHPRSSLSSIQSQNLDRKLQKLYSDNQELQKKYTDALEHILEDFYIRLQFFQIQRDAQSIIDEELQLISQQYEAFFEQLKQSIESIRKGVPNDPQKWLDLNKFMFAFQMENAETKFHEEISKLKKICSGMLENDHTKSMVSLVLDRCDKIAQMLPEHADIIHLEKLWSWTHKKIEIDEAVPLRYTVEQFFYTRLFSDLTDYHNRWMEFLKVWANQIDQQEQFFLFSFYSLRQEWTDPINGWQKADRKAVHKALKENSQPTLLQLEKIFKELDEEYNRFETNTRKIFQETVDDLEDVIFDPGLRQKLLKLASEGSGLIAAILGLVLNLGQADVFKQWPVAQRLFRIVEKAGARWLVFKSSLKPPPPPTLSPLPPYYSRVFMVDPLEVSSLFVGREKELDTMTRLCERSDNSGRCTIAVVGQAGYGKRSLIDYFINNRLQVDTVSIHLALIEDNIVAGINNQTFSLDRMIRKIQLDRFRVVVLDGLENCFVERVGGAQPLLDFFEWLQKTARDIIWIVIVNELAWKTIKQLDKTAGTFTHILQLNPLSPREIKEMLYHRHDVVGTNLKFKIPNNRYFKWLHKVRPQVAIQQLENYFFAELNRRCMGNPAIALKLWTNQCKMLDENTIMLDPIFKNTPLPRLNDDELLVLRIILTQGRVGPEHLQPAVVSSKSLRVCLDNLEKEKLISIRRHTDGTMFSVNTEAYLTIYRVLQEALLLP